jgi:nucleotide-binding universal stress UspA family protein
MKTILVPVDFSDVTPTLLKVAGDMAEVFRARVVLLHVAEPEPEFVGFEAGPVSVRNAVARDLRAEHQQLDHLGAPLRERGIEVVALQIQGSIIEKVLQEAQEQQADLIILGSHGHGALYHLLMGSVTEGVLKKAACPVMVVPSAAK